MSTAVEWEMPSADDLRARGSIKWDRYPEAIGAWVAEMDYPLAPPVQQALHHAIDSSVTGYVPATMHRAMAEACARWHDTRYGWNVDAERIFALPDVVKGIEVAIEHFSPPGSAVVIPSPAYTPFLTTAARLGREVIEVPLSRSEDGWSLDLDGIDRAFTNGGGILILCNPHNPVGKVFSRPELEELSAVVARHGVRVFSDEIHAPLVFEGRTHVPYASVSDQAARQAITATSASKGWNLPGLKCAQLIITGGEEDLEVWERIGESVSHGAAILGVLANTASYTTGGRWLDAVLRHLDHNRWLMRDLLRENLPGVRYLPPEGTYLAWLDFRAYGLGDAPAEILRERAGVAMTDGAACGIAGRGFARFTLATPRPLIEESVKRLAAVLA